MLSRRGFLGSTLAAFAAAHVHLAAPLRAATVQPGLWRSSDGRIFRYMRMPRACAAGDLVMDGEAIAGVAIATLRAGQAGWVQIYGPARVRVEAAPRRPYRPGFVDHID